MRKSKQPRTGNRVERQGCAGGYVPVWGMVQQRIKHVHIDAPLQLKVLLILYTWFWVLGSKFQGLNGMIKQFEPLNAEP
jgi:hypothetical protein